MVCQAHPALEKTGLMLARIFKFLSGLSICIHLDRVLRTPCPPIDGLKGHWSVSRRGPEPVQFFGDPASLARDNTYITQTLGHMGIL